MYTPKSKWYRLSKSLQKRIRTRESKVKNVSRDKVLQKLYKQVK